MRTCASFAPSRGWSIGYGGRGLCCFALRACRFSCGPAALWSGQFWPQPPSELAEKSQSPLAADERGLRTIALSVLICVHPRPNLPFPDFFSNVFRRFGGLQAPCNCPPDYAHNSTYGAALVIQRSGSTEPIGSKSAPKQCLPEEPAQSPEVLPPPEPPARAVLLLEVRLSWERPS